MSKRAQRSCKSRTVADEDGTSHVSGCSFVVAGGTALLLKLLVGKLLLRTGGGGDFALSELYFFVVLTFTLLLEGLPLGE